MVGYLKKCISRRREAICQFKTLCWDQDLQAEETGGRPKPGRLQAGRLAGQLNLPELIATL